MSINHVRDPDAGAELAEHLSSVSEFALDLEAAGFHRYSDRLCLVQVTTDRGTWIVDPLAFDVRDVLADPVQDPDTRTVMHGADFDIRLLDRDLDLRVSGLFDTQAAASLLGETALGLGSLLEKHMDVKLSKKHQKADWAQRPLPDELLEYAADDTRYLLELGDDLRRRLREQGRLEWARSEFRALESIRHEEAEDEDPVTGVKGAWNLDLPSLERLREALAWRDEIAREWDRAHFRVIGDKALMTVADERPGTVDELAGTRGVSGKLARDRGQELLRRFDEADRRPQSELEPYPPRPEGSGRPPPEVEERKRRLKTARNRRAEELGIDRGTLLPNAMLEEIARRRPGSRSEMERIPGVKEWQVEAAGEAVLSVLSGEEAA